MRNSETAEAPRSSIIEDAPRKARTRSGVVEEARPHLLGNEECPHYFLEPGSLAGEYIDIGNGATLLPSKALILACPCFFTSSMRRIECIGSMVHLQPANSDLMRSSPGSRTTVERSPNTSSSISMNPNSRPWLTLRA